MPALAVFPKCYKEAICNGAMTLEDWIDVAAGLDVDGLELYSGFLVRPDAERLRALRDRLRKCRLVVPMWCHSPDFTHPDPVRRREAVVLQREAIALLAALDAPPPRTCRVLSGQRWPGVGLEQGLAWAREGIHACLEDAVAHRVVLALENHYKDSLWQYPEFAQAPDLFLRLLAELPVAQVGVQFDPSNALVAGADPLALLEQVRDRVVSVHASDRSLKPGYGPDALRHEDAAPRTGYADILQHGAVGAGANDYDAIFATLAARDFDGWVSIEDGMDGMDELRQSAAFLRAKLATHFGPRGRSRRTPLA